VRLRRAGVDRADVADDAGLVQQPFRESCLTGVYVRQDSEVELFAFRHAPFPPCRSRRPCGRRWLCASVLLSRSALGLRRMIRLRGSAGPALLAEPEERDLARAERESRAGPDLLAQVAEVLVVQVLDGAAALADEVMVRVLVRGLVVRAAAAEVRAQEKALVDEQFERAIDRRRVHAG